MHQLHLVGFTADHDGLIFSTKKGATSGAYVVEVDDALFSALEEARRTAMAEPDDAAARAAADRVRSLRPTQRSNLSVRDIQSRLRSGMTLAQVAAEAGVDEDWVARFAAPVVAEQAAVVERAMAFSFTTPRRGTSSRPLGEAVRWNLVDRGIVVDTSPQAPGWSAFQLEPGRWAVRFTYSSRGRAQVAEWEVDLEAGELTGRNRLAGDLAYVEAGARRRKPIEVAPPPPPAPKKATAGRKGTPARTRTARAQAAHATSSKAAAARAKAAKASPPRASTAKATPAKRSAAADRKQASSGPAPAARQNPSPPERARAGRSGPAERVTSGGRAGGSGRPAMAGPSPSAAEDRRPTPPSVPRPLGATPGRIGGSPPAGAASDQSTTSRAGARFPAPRPAAGRSDAPASPPRRSDPAAGQAPAASAPVVRVPPPAAGRPRPSAPQPPPRRVPPPERAPTPITADARPMAATTGDGPRAPSTPPVRRLPAATGTAASRRAERAAPPAPPAAPAPAAQAPAPPAPAPTPAPAPQPETPAPTPAPEAQPAPPRPAPAVRPVGGADGRPTILIIDADRAGDRRRP